MQHVIQAKRPERDNDIVVLFCTLPYLIDKPDLVDRILNKWPDCDLIVLMPKKEQIASMPTYNEIYAYIYDTVLSKPKQTIFAFAKNRIVPEYVNQLIDSDVTKRSFIVKTLDENYTTRQANKIVAESISLIDASHVYNETDLPIL